MSLDLIKSSKLIKQGAEAVCYLCVALSIDVSLNRISRCALCWTSTVHIRLGYTPSIFDRLRSCVPDAHLPHAKKKCLLKMDENVSVWRVPVART